MRTGTTAAKTLCGRTRSRLAPRTGAGEGQRQQGADRAAAAAHLVAVGPAAGRAARNEADIVGDIRGQRRVAEEEQRREGDQCPGADDGVDRPAPTPATEIARASNQDTRPPQPSVDIASGGVPPSVTDPRAAPRVGGRRASPGAAG